jgi:hypothetical protein
MKTQLLTLFAAALFGWSSGTYAQQDSTLLENNMPEWVKPILEKSEIAQNHTILTGFNPFYFEADLTGDNYVEIAFYVENKLDHSKGVMIVNNVKNLVFIIGCGNPTEMGSSLSWTKRWFVYRDKVIMNRGSNKKVMLKYPALQLIGEGNSTLVIYWSGKKYKTFIQET